MKNFIINLICKKYNFDRSNIYMLRSNHKDSKDDEFKNIFETEEFRKNSLLDYSRAYFLYQCVKNLEQTEGSLAECGTYRGGSAYLIAKTLKSPINLHLFDSFEGMPDLISTFDTHKKGDLKNTSYEHVCQLMSPFKNVYIYKGLFSSSFPKINESEKFKFVHCDADIYQSVQETNEFFYPRLVKGGMLVYDDYGWASTKGAQKAVLDFYKNKAEYPIYLPTRQAFIIKQ